MANFILGWVLPILVGVVIAHFAFDFIVSLAAR